jgi:hypothetical protein
MLFSSLKRLESSLIPRLKDISTARDPKALNEILGELEIFVQTASTADCSVIAYYLGNFKTFQPTIWPNLFTKLQSKQEISNKHIIRFLYGFSKLPENPFDPRSLLDKVSIPNLNQTDLVMLLHVAHRFNAIDFTQELEHTLISLNPSLPADAIITLWKTSSSSTNPKFLDFLYEQSRTLRNSPKFTDVMFMELLRTTLRLKISDARVFYQLINFVNTKSIRKDFFVECCVSFSKLKIQDEKCWRRLANRFEKLAPLLAPEDIDRVSRSFRGRMGERMHGMINLMKSVRADLEEFGSA